MPAYSSVTYKTRFLAHSGAFCSHLCVGRPLTLLFGESAFLAIDCTYSVLPFQQQIVLLSIQARLTPRDPAMKTFSCNSGTRFWRDCLGPDLEGPDSGGTAWDTCDYHHTLVLPTLIQSLQARTRLVLHITSRAQGWFQLTVLVSKINLWQLRIGMNIRATKVGRIF
jgi:hypothetical protein